MKKRLARVAVVLGLILPVGLMVVPVSGAEGGGERKVYQTANLHDFPGMTTDLGGAATLVRTNQAVDVRIAASGLDPNSAYTVWWVIFNNPGACVGGCGLDDLGSPAVEASVFYAAGFLTGIGGTANVTAHLEAGALPEGVDVLIPGGLERGNGFGSEIHLVVRSHGPILPGMVAAQIGSFGGACGVNTCDDQQAVGFPAVS